MKIITKKMFMAGALVLALSINLFAQANLQFTSVNVTDEGAIQFHWTSQSNHVYEIDEADSLIDTNTGSITWKKLYDDYPSQGTNTFIGDFGNYNLTPVIVHPKNSPKRFYRVVDKGLDDLVSDEPTVSIVSPTNGFVASGDLAITVAVSSDQPVLHTKLYVDGQQMPLSDDGSNYVINTCEWGNGPHILFATVKCASGLGDALNGPTITFGHAASAFVPVMFSNLIARISFSQPVFDPTTGQTQQVSAIFADNSDWTLNIVDASSNVVKTASGSGDSMQYGWDGTDNNNQPVMAGVYYYYISAQTNGEAYEVVGNVGNGSSGGSLPPSPNFALSESPESWVMSGDGGSAVPLALYPPGFDTNDLTIFSATSAEISAARVSAGRSAYGPMNDNGGFTPNASGGNSPVSAQYASRTPIRPPTKPSVGIAGLFGIAHQDYFPEMLTIAAPANGLIGKVYIQGSTQDSKLPFVESLEDEDFIETMARGAWRPGFNKANSDLKASDLRKSSFGGANIFNNGVSLGILHLHGEYGTSPDYTTGANGAQQIYFAVDGRPTSAASYVKMSEMDLGSPGTNGLKWMVLSCCNSLRQQNWDSIQNAGWKPFNQNLHLLLGANTEMDAGNDRMFAKLMLGLDGNQRQTIMEAWRLSALYCLHQPVQFAVAGFDDCKQDFLTGTNSYTPQGSTFYQLLQTAQ